MNIHAYYSRLDVQKEIIRIAKDREVQVWFGLDKRGKRPEVLNFVGDLKDLIRQGVTSFHISEERWNDPLLLKPGMNKKELNENRKGWDLCLDIDGKDFELSRIACELILEVFKLHNIKDYTLKFSGNRGLHIGIPFETFPNEVNGIEIKNYFPESIRVIASYINSVIEELLKDRILKWKSIDQLAKDYFQGDKTKLLKNGEFNSLSVVDIDSVLISSRHLLRAPYSLNEKSGLVSIIIKDIKTFKKEDAKPENVIVDHSFLNTNKITEGSSKELLVTAFDWFARNKKVIIKSEENKEKKEYEMPKIKVEDKFFPPCIKLLMKGLQEDGRKRGVFIAINFLRHAGWDFETIENYLLDWNKRNYEPLRENEIKGQIIWFKKQKSNPLPPNCNNESYYKGIGICKPDELCSRIKNPVNYMNRKLFLEINKDKKKMK
jgi:DNA primase catalytic subunit